MANLENMINQAIADFNDIEKAIEESGVDVPYDTDTSQYGALIKEGVVPKAYEAGKKDEHAKFWDEYQTIKNGELGKRKDYSNAFAFGWSFANFYPKYDIKPEGNANNIFYAWSDSFTSTRYSLKKRLKECGVVLDTSKVTSLTYGFAYSPQFTEIPTLDLTGLTSNPTGLFANCYYDLRTVSFKVNENTPMGNWFGSNTTGVVNLTIEGVIGKSGFNVSNLNSLSHDSLMSIVNALKDYSTDTSGTVYTVTLGSKNIEKLTDTEIDIIEAKGWQYK